MSIESTSWTDARGLGVVATCVVLAMAVALPIAGCAPSNAAPLEVTYYYLPG